MFNQIAGRPRFSDEALLPVTAAGLNFRIIADALIL